MTNFFRVDDDGVPISWHRGRSIPADAIEGPPGITDPVTFASHYRFGTSGWEAREPDALVTDPYDVLDGLRDAARRQVNATIGSVRLLYITDGPSQGAVYLAKETEARAYLALPNPPADVSAFPFLAAETGITAPTETELAQLWVARADAWRAVASQLEAARMTAQNAITIAADSAAIEAAMAALAATLATITQA